MDGMDQISVIENSNIGGAGVAKRGYSVTEVADLFGVTRATIHNWLDEKAKRFPNAYQLGDTAKSANVIPPDDIEKVRDEEIARYNAEIEALKGKIKALRAIKLDD